MPRSRRVKSKPFSLMQEIAAKIKSGRFVTQRERDALSAHEFLTGGAPPKKAKVKVKRAPRRKIHPFYSSEEWKKLRYEAFERYGNKCSCCGASPAHGVRVQMDHIIPISKAPHLKLDITNLQPLCDSCNWGKGNRFETCWLDDRYAEIMSETD